MRFKPIYGKHNSPNVAEMLFRSSESVTRFAGNQAKLYLEERIASITEPHFPFEGIVDIPGLLLTPIVFGYYLVTAPFLYKKLKKV